MSALCYKTQKGAGALATDSPQGPANGEGEDAPTALGLRRFALLRELSEQALTFVFNNCVLHPANTQSPKVSVFGGRTIWFAWSGAYRILAQTPNGTPVTLSVLRAGEHFGEACLLAPETQQTFKLVCDQSGLLLAVSRDPFSHLLQETPELRGALMRAMAWSAIHAHDRIFALAALDSRTRLISEILRWCGLEAPNAASALLAPAPTHDTLASLIGSTREVVTRHLRTLNTEGLIQSRRGEIVVPSVARLRHIVEVTAGRALLYHHRPIGPHLDAPG